MTSKKKYLTLKSEPQSWLGKTISYIQNLPLNNQALAAQTIQARFLPFALSKDDPRHQEIALQCAIECEAWARMIREHAGLSVSSVMSTPLMPIQVLPHAMPSNSVVNASVTEPESTIFSNSVSDKSIVEELDEDEALTQRCLEMDRMLGIVE